MLRDCGYDFVVLPVAIDEMVDENETAVDAVARLSQGKAMAACKAQREFATLPILTADTLVAIDTTILGKPRDEADAARMLSRLSGNTHQVHTAVTLINPSTMLKQTLVSSSDVTFRDVSAREIDAYVATGEPMDKAGAYAIQGLAGLFVSALSGSYSGIVGLPLCETGQLLAEHDITVL